MSAAYAKRSLSVMATSETPNPAIRFLRFDYDGYERALGTAEISGRFASFDEACKASSSLEHCSEILDTWTGKQWEFSSGMYLHRGETQFRKVHDPRWEIKSLALAMFLIIASTSHAVEETIFTGYPYAVRVAQQVENTIINGSLHQTIIAPPGPEVPLWDNYPMTFYGFTGFSGVSIDQSNAGTYGFHWQSLIDTLASARVLHTGMEVEFSRCCGYNEAESRPPLAWTTLSSRNVNQATWQPERLDFFTDDQAFRGFYGDPYRDAGLSAVATRLWVSGVPEPSSLALVLMVAPLCLCHSRFRA